MPRGKTSAVGGDESKEPRIIYLRLCRLCDAPLGGVRAVMRLEVCPECQAPVIPVEDCTTPAYYVERSP